MTLIPTTPAPPQDTTANPAPLGLCAFGLTTVLLNIHNAGFYEMNSMILAMGIFYGGLAQVIAGIIEAKKNNTFGLTAFTSYGFFWLSLVGLLVMPKLGWAAPASKEAMAAYLGIWGVFTFCLFFGTLRLNRALQFVFASLTVLFFLLVAARVTGNESLEHFAGYEGIVCGASAIYTGIANVLNEVYKKTVLPIGPVN
ncbi:acetate uptake transporter [Mucilaginibacter sp. RS28]|uniref:Acetate uptake transporter n=1 Tax=Mucilaginibacter straminoryzae TaxID=2932774 RepID=A0A9X1X6M5_9SPHI|nr:acetate uptake transporter [Mucilaginibacter straminoryzae]MCJ8211551.1 acetate uptake transporter [Mucilaginibacter straminoryzae]